MRKTLKIIGSLFLILVVLAGLFIALNYTYLKRTFTGFEVEQVRDIEWFEPKAPLQAFLNSEDISRADKSLLTQEQNFEEALSYAESINSSAFLVWQGGELIVEKYWESYNSESYTQTHSIHKSLLSMAVGIAVDEGDIGSIKDPVASYLGAWIDQSMGSITIEHLLNMSSGLGKEPGKIPLFSHFVQLLNATDISKVAQSLPQKMAPGEEFEYINNNPQLLVDVLEQATGTPYEVYLEEKIWSKMAANPGYLWMDREDGTPHGYCCLMALPEDLLRIGLLVLNEGQAGGEQIVPKSWVQDAIAPSELNPNYGYLIWRGSPHTPFRKYHYESEFGVPHSEPYLADDVLFFDGFGGQRVYIVPSRDLVIVRVGETRFDFDDSILPNRVIEALDQTTSDREIALDSKVNFDVEYKDLVLETDHSGSINVRVSYPVNHLGAANGDKTHSHPLILFSHGHYLTNESYHALIDKWVKQGYVVTAPLHLDTGEMEDVNALSEKVGSDWISASRGLDLISILNQTGFIEKEIDGFKGQIRNDKVIAAGHSFGALTSQLLGGATLELQGNSVYPIPDILNDDRIAAIVAVSPPGTVPDHISKKTWETLSTPQLVVTGTEDFFEYVWPDYRSHFVSYETAVEGDNYLLVLDGMDHYFGNLIGRLNREEEPQEEALELMAEQSLLFMDSYLDTKTSAVSAAKLNDMDTFLQQPGVDAYERR